MFFFPFVPLQGDDGFPGHPGQKVILNMKIGFVPLIFDGVYSFIFPLILQGEAGDPGPKGLPGPRGNLGQRVKTVQYNYTLC